MTFIRAAGSVQFSSVQFIFQVNEGLFSNQKAGIAMR